MLEKALRGNRGYWTFLLFLVAVIAAGAIAYAKQLSYGLGVTGLSRDVSWGLYIGQLTFLVGVAASAVMVVLPYYLHNYKAFGKITILGEFVAVSSIIMCILFVLVDLGRPERVFNTILHPTPGSLLFWDIVVLNGYFLLNLVIGWTVLGSDYKGVRPPAWVKPVIYLSIPWAISIHTVTAFLYAGLPGRGFWLTAIMAPRFLGSAFAAGPALLILLCYVLKRFARFDVGREAIRALSIIVTYAMLASVFFVICELFTVYYSGIPEHTHHFTYLYAGLEGHRELTPLMWSCVVMGLTAVCMLIVPKIRNNEKLLPIACVFVFFSLWIEKGISLVVGGFIPSPLETVTSYLPTCPEIMITLGIWAVGFLMITIFYKVAIAVVSRKFEIIGVGSRMAARPSRTLHNTGVRP